MQLPPLRDVGVSDLGAAVVFSVRSGAAGAAPEPDWGEGPPSTIKAVG